MWSRPVANTWHVDERLLISKFNSTSTRKQAPRFQRTRNRRADLAIRCRAYSWIEAHSSSSSSSSSYRSPISNCKIGRAPPIDIPFAPLRICSWRSAMASSGEPKLAERESKEDENEGKGGFLDKVKDFIHDVGERIEEAVGFGKPTADVTAVHLPSINMKKADIVVDVLVTNPNPIPIPLVDIDYLIESDGRKLVSGLIPDAGTIHAHGSETVKIPVTLIYDDIKNTYGDIKPGSIIPYRVKVDLIVDVPVFGRITLPLEKTGEIPVPYKPDIDVEKIHFDKFSFEETIASLHLKLENKNDFDLGLNALDYEFWLSEISISSAKFNKTTTIEKNGVARMEIPISFRPKDFGSALWDMIRGRGTGYSIKGSIDADTPFGHMNLPISKEGGTTRLKKGDEDDDDNED
ncbi:uncharacterized protein LOC122009416 isoform X2 [Zingiber officinale]|uniref:uncharacterized protein LOC122009416 isoform X2 n=1 Tax=Zingiber officinale TaxID=94328 RepID=UPI001C4B6307|nr:uncharacterized protein LOC122009416 isoform X2 [Zingiber officinale]